MIDFEHFFSKFYVARKPIISGGAIRLFAILLTPIQVPLNMSTHENIGWLLVVVFKYSMKDYINFKHHVIGN